MNIMKPIIQTNLDDSKRKSLKVCETENLTMLPNLNLNKLESNTSADYSTQIRGPKPMRNLSTGIQIAEDGKHSLIIQSLKK